jgi:hypothetical protein
MKTVSPMFRTIYNIIVSFETTPRGNWYILCEGDLSELKSDFQAYGVTCEGDLRTNVSISIIAQNLPDDFAKRRFIAGLADTIGSTTKSHRRFTDDVQILSFELKGFNFAFICDVCRLLYSVNCYPDQILWNHPNFHAASNCYYSTWTKGHKLRVQLDQYAEWGAFAFTTKAEASAENRSLQQSTNAAVPCPEREVRATPSCVHPAEHDERLPSTIKGGHYIHNRHVCAVLGCEHAPYEAIKALFSDAGHLINPFPIMCRDTILRIEEIIKDDPLLANRNYLFTNVAVEMFYRIFQEDSSTLMYGDGSGTSGYPITEIMQGIAYIIANENELNGTRVRGNYIELIERHIKNNAYNYVETSEELMRVAEQAKTSSIYKLAESMTGYFSRDISLVVEMRKPDLLTPLVFAGNGKGVLIGARNPRVYKRLVSLAPNNDYKLYVRKITEGDLTNA